MLRLLPLRQNAIHIVRSAHQPSSWRGLITTTPCFRNPSGSPSRFRKTKPLKASFDISSLNSKQLEGELIKRLNSFPRDSIIRRKAKSFGIRDGLFLDIAHSFSKEALSGRIAQVTVDNVRSAFNGEEGSEFLDKVLWSAFLDHAEPFLPPEAVEKHQSLKKISDLRFPSEWFPDARQMKRQIILHVGPTNSGKTYRALKRLEEAESGIYCGPLRLLAHEIFEKMNDKGVACNLLTGEERREVAPFAPLTSSTVEMAPIGKTLDVAVIDEIQMIADPDRGWAWTQALLGLKAKEIHLCGEASAVPLVRKICETLDEDIIVNEYERLTPFTVSEKSLMGDISKVQKGDCVVSFSRKNIFNYKSKIEASTDLRCAVAYGSLPPETRALQAKAFNDPNSGFDVLVASDAVGMGLNLNIKRIVFTTVDKFNGKDTGRISVPQMKQIAGRAGRFGTSYKDGEVTTLNARDLCYVEECVAAPIIPLEMAGLQPTVDILELFALQMPNERFSGLLQKFEEMASLNGDYFLCNYRDQKAIAERLESIKLPLRDRYQFVTAPVSVKNESAMDLIEDLARVFSGNKTRTLNDVICLPDQPPTTELELTHLEESHKKIILYMWLSQRYPEVYNTAPEQATEAKVRCEVMIDDVLKNSSTQNKSKKTRGVKAFKKYTSSESKTKLMKSGIRHAQ